MVLGHLTLNNQTPMLLSSSDIPKEKRLQHTRGWMCHTCTIATKECNFYCCDKGKNWHEIDLVKQICRWVLSELEIHQVKAMTDHLIPDWRIFSIVVKVSFWYGYYGVHKECHCQPQVDLSARCLMTVHRPDAAWTVYCMLIEVTMWASCFAASAF